MIKKIYKFICDDCAETAEYSDKSKAGDFGWATSHGGKNHYCPACALSHRSTGCTGAKTKKTGEQLKLIEVKGSA